MEESIKIKFEELDRVHLGFPSVWTEQLDDGRLVCIWYRQGRIKILVSNEPLKRIVGFNFEKDGPEKLTNFKLLFNEFNPLDEFDVGGYLSDEDLKKVLNVIEWLHA